MEQAQNGTHRGAVLVVEDEGMLRTVITKNLAARGYRTVGAASADEAILRLRGAPVEVLVLDINLPDGTGWDVLRAVADEHLARPEVIVLSAVHPSQGRLREFGPLAFVEKPFPIESLLRAVARAAKQAVES